MMALFFAQRVMNGRTAFEKVPSALKADVAEILIKNGKKALVPVEYGGTKVGEV